MDTIWNCAFGVDINIQFDKSKEEYFEKCEAIFLRAINRAFISKLSSQYLASRNLNGILFKTLSFKVYFHEFKFTFFDFLVLVSRIMVRLNGQFSNPYVWLQNNVIQIVDARNKEHVSERNALVVINRLF